jgi:superfamily II DNA/RNA helicase
MAAFAAGEIDVLVATTVIEVGVDVANATLMVIEHAERFGLAQLHQLRGRVGRGSHDSVCVLLYQQPLSATARARLKIIFEHTDGFEIARQDLRLRGPGEFVGSRQSGVPLLRYADLEARWRTRRTGDTAACSPRSCRAPPAALARESRGTAESLKPRTGGGPAPSQPPGPSSEQRCSAAGVAAPACRRAIRVVHATRK